MASSGEETPPFAESVHGNWEPLMKKALAGRGSFASSFEYLIKMFPECTVERKAGSANSITYSTLVHGRWPSSCNLPIPVTLLQPKYIFLYMYYTIHISLQSNSSIFNYLLPWHHHFQQLYLILCSVLWWMIVNTNSSLSGLLKIMCATFNSKLWYFNYHYFINT